MFEKITRSTYANLEGIEFHLILSKGVSQCLGSDADDFIQNLKFSMENMANEILDVKFETPFNILNKAMGYCASAIFTADNEIIVIYCQDANSERIRFDQPTFEFSLTQIAK